MASTYSSSLKLELMETGANANTWGNNTNTNLQTVDAFTAGYIDIDISANSGSTYTLSSNNADPTAEASNKVLDLYGTLTDNITVALPAVENNYIIYNNTAGAYTLTVDLVGSPGNSVTVTQGTYAYVYSDGTNVKNIFSDLALEDVTLSGNLTVTGNSTVTGTSTLTGDVTASGNISVTGTSTLTGDVTASGNVSVTGTSTLTGDVTASGNVNVSTNVTVTGTMTAGTVVETSSIAYKENIRSLEATTEAILSMDPVVYDRKDGSQKNEVGLIAEEVYKIAPELVHLKDGNPEGIKYTKLAVYLLHAIKDLKKDLDVLKKDK